MGFKLGIDTPNSAPHPAFEIVALGDALAMVEKAIRTSCIHVQGVTIQTGPGTIYKVISDDHLESLGKGEAEAAMGVRERLKAPRHPHTLVIQTGGAQLEPLSYATAEEMSEAVKTCVEEGVLRHTGLEGHEYTFIQGNVGNVYMEQTTEKFEEHQQMRMAEEMRQSASKPMIVVPD
jgi:hypothetical protein